MGVMYEKTARCGGLLCEHHAHVEGVGGEYRLVGRRRGEAVLDARNAHENKREYVENLFHQYNNGGTVRLLHKKQGRAARS